MADLYKDTGLPLYSPATHLLRFCSMPVSYKRSIAKKKEEARAYPRKGFITPSVPFAERWFINMKKLEDYVRSIPDFPEPGIIFRDITTILQSPESLQMAVDQLVDAIGTLDYDVVVGPESRGFIFGVPVAYVMKKGFVPVRKKGKLPCETVSAEYDLEYGSAEIEMHKDSIKPGQKVVIIDDLIATGGTIEAIIKLVEELGGQVVKVCFVMELAGLEGRKRLSGYDVASLITYPGK